MSSHHSRNLSLLVIALLTPTPSVSPMLGRGGDSELLCTREKGDLDGQHCGNFGMGGMLGRHRKRGVVRCRYVGHGTLGMEKREG